MSMMSTTNTRKLLRDRPRYLQVVTAGIAPAVLGAIAGILLGVAAPAYWAISVLAAIGGFVDGGFEHRDWRGGVVRGVVGGGLYGIFLLVVHNLSGLRPKVSLGSLPPLVIVITAILGILLTLGGTLIAGTRERSGRRPRSAD